jgi:hypothetical protein
MRFPPIVVALTLLVATAASAQNLHRPWEFPVPSKHFPEFFSSNLRCDILLNDLFARHWFAPAGPSAYAGNQQAFWREWDSLCTAWMDTSRNKVLDRDYKADLKSFLLSVQMDPDGYVFTYPPNSVSRNKLGWPFPDYTQSAGLSRGWDWDKPEAGQNGWTLTGGGTTTIGTDSLWNMILTEPDASIQASDLAIEAFQSPYVIVQMAVGRPGTAALEWTTDKEPDWSEKNRVEFAVSASKSPVDYWLPVYRRSGWRGRITALRLRPLTQVPADGIEVALDRIHCAYDTRQPVNNTSFILACRRYYLWTGDDDFLRKNMARIRAAAHYLRYHLKGDEEGMVVIPYWGHDGTSGISPKSRVGYGLGSDYWDLLPMGCKSAYTNAYYAAALRAMADLEDIALHRRIADVNPYGEDADSFSKQANLTAKRAGSFFWDEKAGRFIGCEDATGKRHDYGFVYLNLEALYYGLGSAEKAERIYSWLDGSRTIEGDSSTGKDIYHWRFAPRSTTKRNLDWYIWLWSDPGSVPWGGQVQDGGAPAYLSFYDIMNRIKYRSPDDAYARLKEILDWYLEVWDGAGYRDYYKQAGRGTLQGGGTPGGLGIDAEFVETTLVPLTFLYGFLGIDATPDGLVIEPKLPKELGHAGVRGLFYRGVELTIAATPGKITVKCTRNPANRSFLLSGRRVSGSFEKTVDGNYAILKPAD